MASLTVHGAGGHGKVVCATAVLLGYQVHQTDEKWNTSPGDELCHIALGDNRYRKGNDRPNLQTLIHPTAFVDETAKIGAGCYIGPNAVVHTGAKVGRGTIINTGAIVEHDCVVGDWVHLAPGSVLCGAAKVGAGTFVGANAVIKQGVTVGDNVTIGCGAVVLDDKTEGCWVGNPARYRLGIKGG